MEFVYKKIGETNLSAMKRHYGEYSDKKTFVGRLDPMAEGIFIVLKGNEIREKDRYINLNKKYEYEGVLGISTDTFDSLGIVEDVKKYKGIDLEKIIKETKGKYEMLYPPYSSKTLNGKPLWEIARERKIREEELPKKDIEIFEHTLLHQEYVKAEDITDRILRNIKLVQGDFRKEEVSDSWRKFLEKHKGEKFIKFKASIHCSTGTYVRRIVVDIGKKLNLPAFAYSINRKEMF